MEKSNFIDYIRVFCKSGHGGAGSKHFMRTKFNAMAGPDGAMVGVVVILFYVATNNCGHCCIYVINKNVIAENGENGSKNNSSGKNGKDIFIEVPLGTIARDDKTGNWKRKFYRMEQEMILMPGGRGGLGNANFCNAHKPGA